MIQYKLLEVLDEETRKKIYDIFEEEDIYFFTKKIVGIKYDFKNLNCQFKSDKLLMNH